MSFRKRAAMLADEIARSLPEYTVHDITHLDALWQMADLIAGPDYELTPTEAFVLGGAFLIHDLGNGLAAYPDGIAAMHASTAWRDAVSLVLRKEIGHAPTTEDIENASEIVKERATANVLRSLHAQQAERLALVSWRDPDAVTQRFLIEDVFLRETYGGLIGRIAHSHWWNAESLKPEFEFPIGAPVDFPADWTVDALKLACLLRVADAAHLDASRAPAFLKALRQLPSGSREYWFFQERLQQPMRSADRLIYTSSRPFTHIESRPWWLCFDALQMLDQELIGADSILADCHRARFAVRGVQGAEDASRLSRWIQTEGWSPVDTRIKVTDVAELASRLGGSQLYGSDNLVPLRELIQNSTDAIRARRYLECRNHDYGDITVRLGCDDEGHWIEVADNGIGMSQRVMTGPLLDFGISFWNSEYMAQELPGLAASGFESTGEYGIGFFSLFMWGNHVRVTSRSYRDGPRETRVLEFVKGLQNRPTLREALPHEYLIDGGTAVRIWVGEEPEMENGVLFREGRRRKKLEDICEWLCPAIDANLYIQRPGFNKQIVICAGDWRTLDGEKLLQRVNEDFEHSPFQAEAERLIPVIATNLMVLRDKDKDVVGRLAVIPAWGIDPCGAVTAGGLRSCGLSGIAGIVQGETKTASRNYAIPTVSSSMLADWASAQASALAKMDFTKDILAHTADIIARFGGSAGDLPIAESAQGWLNTAGVRSWVAARRRVVLVSSEGLFGVRRDFAEFELSQDTLACESAPRFFLETHGSESSFWPEESSPYSEFTSRSNHSRVIRLIAESWSVTLERLLLISHISDTKIYSYMQVGNIAGKSIVRSAIALRRPGRASPATKRSTKHK